MKIQDVITHLQTQGSWVNYEHTRDIVLYGDSEQEVKKIGTCWIMTFPVIYQAIAQGVNLIITHENGFYEMTTQPKKLLLEAQKEKKDLLQKAGICVYRCHDLWDRMPKYGVADTWSSLMELSFKPRPTTSMISYGYPNAITVKQLARKIAEKLKPYGNDSVEILGDVNREIQCLAIGAGAANDIFAMLKEPVDCVVVSDDGTKNWIELQYCVDHNIPVIITHHVTAEKPAMKNMATYLNEQFSANLAVYLDEGYKFSSI